MKAMRYLINLKEGKIPELSIFVENYQNKKVFIFINQKDGSFLMNVETGKKRLELIDKETTEVFDVSVDNYIIFDLVDALNNVYSDTKALMKRYFFRSEKTKKPVVPPTEPTEERKG